MEVFLEAFEGPLDLLLYLIRQKPHISTSDRGNHRQYMQYIEVMTELQLDLAGEYLVMAATLAEIKSRMLLPRAAPQGDGWKKPARRADSGACRNTSASSRRRSLDMIPRLERDTWIASAEFSDRRVVRIRRRSR